LLWQSWWHWRRPWILFTFPFTINSSRWLYWPCLSIFGENFWRLHNAWLDHCSAHAICFFDVLLLKVSIRIYIHILHPRYPRDWYWGSKWINTLQFLNLLYVIYKAVVFPLCLISPIAFVLRCINIFIYKLTFIYFIQNWIYFHDPKILWLLLGIDTVILYTLFWSYWGSVDMHGLFSWITHP